MEIQKLSKEEIEAIKVLVERIEFNKNRMKEIKKEINRLSETENEVYTKINKLRNEIILINNHGVGQY